MGKIWPSYMSLVLRTLLTEQCAAMPTYPMVQAVPAGQTGPLSCLIKGVCFFLRT